MGGRFLIVTIRIIWASALISLILLLLAAISLIIYHIVIVSRACRRALSSNINRRDECFKAGDGLSLEDLEKLPCFEFSTPDDERVSAMNCAVCLESFELGDLCRLLPLCRHSFHAYCADCWLVRNPVCPICRSSPGHRRGGDEVGMSYD
ncbi:hypothetical protein KFK09_022960 [Dendrobium nobile]|uniref:RING-type domain-containing protein n=1 Tax=Dendrobium nobile TaxID=94219 RepID=A0A8T3AJP6_DENNO|nr:hypothetical protein KFK09_022960 [Dendrobium nobile]